MSKKIKKLKRAKTHNLHKSKNKKDLIIPKRNKRKIIKKYYDENEYETNLNIIDNYEEDEKERLKIKENEYLIEIQNKKIYTLQICYRPSTNNIELIGNFEYKRNDINKDKNSKNKIEDEDNLNKCTYLLIQDKNIVAPILNEFILNFDKNKNKNIKRKNLKENKIKENSKEEEIKKKQKNKKEKKKINNFFIYIYLKTI